LSPILVLFTNKIFLNSVRISQPGIQTRGETCTVIGRSHNVGLPIALLLAADMARGLLIDSINENYEYVNFLSRISSQIGK